MTADLKQEELSKFKSKFWRLNNLYYILNKDGKKVKFKMNKAQIEVIKDNKHNRKIILKSRQRGITTAYAIYQLDSCIFKENTAAGIQSYGNDESEKVKMKIDFAIANLDQRVKDSINFNIIKDNASTIQFGNNSIIKIGNFRGDTLQLLHVSELGKIAKKYPEKAKELKTGAFQAVSVKNKITVESTAEGRTGLFYELWVKAWAKKKAGIELSPLDFQAIFLSWVDDDDCWLEVEQPITAEQHKYFDKLEKEIGCELVVQKRWWWVAKYDELGFEIYQEYPATPEEAFAQSIEGTYYKEEFENLKMIENAYRPELLVNMAFDLGMNDTFSIGFVQNWIDRGVKHSRIIGYYENNGQGLQHYKDVCDYLSLEKGWVFNQTYVPHDISVRELIAGKSRWQALLDLGFSPVLVTKHLVQDGIETVRRFLRHVEIDVNECMDIIDAIQNYRKKYDDKLEVYLPQPVHDKYSHPADMLRYMAMGLKNSFPTIFYVRELGYDEEDISDTYGYDI